MISSQTKATQQPHPHPNPLDHPFVEVIEHISSPLTSSLIIFGVYKASHIPKIRAWFRAVNILRKSRRSPVQKSKPAPESHTLLEPHHPHQSPGVVNQTRNYHSLARTRVPSSLSASFLSASSRTSIVSSTKSPQPFTGRFLGTQSKRVGLRSFDNLIHKSRIDNQLIFSRFFSQTRVLGSAIDQISEFRHTVTETVQSETEKLAELAQISTFFPQSWYVKSPFTDQLVVYSSEKIQHIINFLHVSMGLSWWQSMIGVTLLFRFLVLPLNIGLVRNTLRLHRIKPEIHRLDFLMQNGTEEEKVKASKDLIELLKKNKCHPAKNILSPILFPPMFLSLFGAVYDLCTHLPEASHGGTLWFQDLSAHDPTFVLPVFSALSWLATIEMASGVHFPLKPWMLSATRLTAIAFVPVTMTLPSGVFLFWLTSNTFACVRALVVRQKPIARLFGIPTADQLPPPQKF